MVSMIGVLLANRNQVKNIAVNMSPMYVLWHDWQKSFVFNLIIFYDMFILQISSVSFYGTEANILLALIEGCGWGWQLGCCNKLLLDCWWWICIYRKLLLIIFLTFKKIDKLLIIHLLLCNQVIFLLQQMHRGALKYSQWDFLGRMVRYSCKRNSL